MLSYVITIVGGSRPPVMTKFLLRFSAAEPVETHVHGFGSTRGNSIFDNSERCGVVCLHWRRWLWMSHGDEGVSGGYRFADIDVESSKFGLCCRGHYGLDHLSNGEDSSIGRWVAGVV